MATVEHKMLAKPVPLEHLSLSIILSGEKGVNRNSGSVTQQIGANNDLQAIQTWLSEFNDSPQTQRTYRKEVERLLLWSLIVKRIALSSLTRNDLQDYQSFLEKPEPTEQWCGPRQSRHHPQWRPFQGPLSVESIAHAFTIINALFNYLVEAGYLCGNPLGLMRRKLKKRSNKQVKMTERYLEQPLWQCVVNYIEHLPQHTHRDKTNYERKRYLLHLLYLLGPRVSEVAQHTMSSIRQIRGKWWWEITGKGNKTHTIPINNAMLQALIRYRNFYGLPSLPTLDDKRALFLNLSGKKGVSSNMIYRLVKQIFLECAKTLEKERPDFAKKLKQASTHWLRHTAITHQTDRGIELRYIKRNARHESVETTMLYQHAEDEKWHDAMSSHVVIIEE